MRAFSQRDVDARCRIWTRRKRVVGSRASLELDRVLIGVADPKNEVVNGQMCGRIGTARAPLDILLDPLFELRLDLVEAIAFREAQKAELRVVVEFHGRLRRTLS